MLTCERELYTIIHKKIVRQLQDYKHDIAKGGYNMFELNKRTNLLTRPEKNHQLEDVDTPNMFREFYPYDEIPRVAFNDLHVPMCMPDEIL